MRKITKAVFPVAGLGSRFLPATKAQPKEMLPIVDKPLIQYAVEEAVVVTGFKDDRIEEALAKRGGGPRVRAFAGRDAWSCFEHPRAHPASTPAATAARIHLMAAPRC